MPSAADVRVPSFFVIGAMKSGTTSLYRDLARHPAVALADKESAGLQRYDVGSSAGRRQYLAMFPTADPGRVLGEITTTYAMSPHQPPVAEAASRLAPGARIVYLVREPVARIISHHHHDLANGLMTVGIDEAVRQDGRFLDYSRYAGQLDCWRRHFPDEAILVVRFEDFVADRHAVAGHVLGHLGLPALPLSEADAQVHNASSTKRISRGTVGRVVRSRAYRDRLRPLIPGPVRRRLADVLLSGAGPRPAPPSTATVAFLCDVLAEDLARLSHLTEGRIGWDMEQVADEAAARGRAGQA